LTSPAGPAAPNSIHCGDCLAVLGGFPDACIDLAYIDPPFNSSRDHARQGRTAPERHRFGDRFADAPAYISYMRPRVEQLHRVLRPTGSFYYHCDWHASHHIRLLLDEVFGAERFLNEIIWRYRTGGGAANCFARKHDTLFLYTRGPAYTFNPLKEKAYTRSRSRRPGLINYGGGAAEFFEDAAGVYNLVSMSDVWDIPYINSQAKERLGYPTQKPLALLERVVAASSQPGDIVLDAFCGCGTTLAAAARLGRCWIGIDISQGACRLSRQRLDPSGAAAAEGALPASGPSTPDV
jgi:DNA modification methylase